jgi:hypothetical protein
MKGLATLCRAYGSDRMPLGSSLLFTFLVGPGPSLLAFGAQQQIVDTNAINPRRRRDTG